MIDALNSIKTAGHDALDSITEWVNGRIFCAACRKVAWVIAHPQAVIVCRHCGGPVVPASGDEV